MAEAEAVAATDTEAELKSCKRAFYARNMQKFNKLNELQFVQQMQQQLQQQQPEQLQQQQPVQRQQQVPQICGQEFSAAGNSRGVYQAIDAVQHSRGRIAKI